MERREEKKVLYGRLAKLDEDRLVKIESHKLSVDGEYYC